MVTAVDDMFDFFILAAVLTFVFSAIMGYV